MELNDFIKHLENNEKDVDRILKAARLDRHNKEPMSDKRLEVLLGCGLVALSTVLVFGLFFAAIYFHR